MRERKRERVSKGEGQRERERENLKQAACSVQSDTGLDPMTLGSGPELKSRVGYSND